MHQVLKDYEHNLEDGVVGSHSFTIPASTPKPWAEGFLLVEAKDRVSSGTWSLEGRSFFLAWLLKKLCSVVVASVVVALGLCSITYRTSHV